MSGNGKKNNNKIIERLKEKYEVVDFVETQYKSHIIDILNEKYTVITPKNNIKEVDVKNGSKE